MYTFPNTQDDRDVVYVMMERQIAEVPDKLFDTCIKWMSILSSSHWTLKNQQNCRDTGDEFSLLLHHLLILVFSFSLKFSMLKRVH